MPHLTMLPVCVWLAILGLGTARLTQRDYCSAIVVIKAKILGPGSIADLSVASSRTPLPDLPRGFRRFELKVIEVFKTRGPPFSPNALKGTLHHAISKDTRVNQDADGCDFYQPDSEALLYFDDWEVIDLKHSCIGWEYGVTMFQKNKLRNNGYDCSCDLDDCFDRLTRRNGLPACSKDWDQMACVQEFGGKCVWKGARNTCVNPVSFHGKYYKLNSRERG